MSAVAKAMSCMAVLDAFDVWIRHVLLRWLLS
jgi:hypothetical protein